MENRAVFFEGEIADYKLTHNGILISYSKPVLRTADNIRSNSELILSKTNGPVPVVVHLCSSPMPDKAARKASTLYMAKNYTAMALISHNGLSTFIMTLLFKLSKPPIPVKHFTNEWDAEKWVLQYIHS